MNPTATTTPETTLISRTFTAPPVLGELREDLAAISAEVSAALPGCRAAFAKTQAAESRWDAALDEAFPPEYLRLSGEVRKWQMGTAQPPRELNAAHQENLTALKQAQRALDEYNRGAGFPAAIARQDKRSTLLQLEQAMRAEEAESAACRNLLRSLVNDALAAVQSVTVPAAEGATLQEIADALQGHFYDREECLRFAQQSPIIRALQRRWHPTFALQSTPDGLLAQAAELIAEIAALLQGEYQFTIAPEPPRIDPQLAEMDAERAAECEADNLETVARIKAQREADQEQERWKKELVGALRGPVAPVAEATA